MLMVAGVMLAYEGCGARRLRHRCTMAFVLRSVKRHLVTPTTRPGPANGEGC